MSRTPPPSAYPGPGRTGAFEPETGGRDASSAESGIGFPGYQPPPPGDEGRSRRSLLMQVIADTFRQRGARLGAVWVSILIILAVFAPFIANSRPLIARWADGNVTYPLLAGLAWFDWTLLVAFFTVLGLLIARTALNITLGHALLIMIAVLGITAPLASLTASPPALVEWDYWRDTERSGELVSATRTIVPFSPNDALADLRESLQRPQQPPNEQNWLGTTVYGEDMLSRMIHATRVALAIGFIATGIAVIIGVTIGSIMGYFAGWTDLLMMRFIEIVEVIPQLILLIIVTSFFGKNIWLMMITIGLIAWTSNARFIRAEFLKLRRQDFVQACVATGLPLRNILFRHMLPNGVAPVLVNASFGIAGAILLESVLSFLGLGLEQTESSWGALLNQAREGGSGFNWWIATFPGLAIFLTVFAYILIGEAMRDAIDPKLKKAGE